MKSTPAKPLTCRSTNPGAAIAAAAAADEPDRRDRAVRDLDVAAHQPPVDERRLDAEPHPFTAPAVVPRIRCLRSRTKTITTGSV